MSRRTRIAQPAPAEFAKRVKAGKPFTVNEVALYPPVRRNTWRVKATIGGRVVERSGGNSADTCYAALLEILDIKQRVSNGQAGLPEKWGKTLASAMQEYIDGGGLHGTWKPATRKNRRSTLAVAIHSAEKHGDLCRDVNDGVLRRLLQESATTVSVAATLLSTLRTFLKWGVNQGYFTIDQARQGDYLVWQRPRTYKPAPTRRAQLRQLAFVVDDPAGEVPTHEQVQQIARAVQDRYRFGEALIILAANTGLRSGEIFALSASTALHKQQKVNLVDTKAHQLQILGQMSRATGGALVPTKNGKPRKVIIPPQPKIRLGFDLRCWLEQRCTDALAEQAAGVNPLALVFPTASGTLYDSDNFRSRVMNPALEALGFALPHYKTVDGKARRMFRFTLHSMRDRFAVTAKDEWGYTEAQLLDQGSWADPQTVRRFYLGTSDDTFDEVKRLHEASSPAPTSLRDAESV